MSSPARKLELPKEPGVPCLPGYKLPKSLSDNQFNKIHTLDYYNGYPVSRSMSTPKQVTEQEEKEIHDLLEKTNQKLRFGARPGNHLQPQAKYTPPSLDDVIFRFNAFVREDYQSGNRGPYPGAIDADAQDHAIRRVIIAYYLEDDSISVVEPQVNNSGLTQGTVLKRQRIPRPRNAAIGEPVEYYTIQDFQVGKDIVFYGRTYHITACDKYTENYTRDVLQLPVTAKPAEQIPKDPYLYSRSQLVQSALASHHQAEASHDRLKRFIEQDRKVLRFYCAWDDRHSYQGELHFVIVHYFIFDDTIEVREIHSANSGHDAFPVLVRRQKLPRQVRGLEDLATTTPLGADHDVKNMHAKDRFYHWRDFKIGSTVNVFGRPFQIYDIDGFTRNHYLQHGVSAKELQPAPKPLSYVEQHANKKVSEKVNTEEASEFLNVQPRRPNMFRMLQNGGKVLRFLASLVAKREEDQGRTFILSYRLADDTMGIVEKENKKLGIASNKFMERGTPKNPATGKFYDPWEIYVGAVLKIYGREFLIEDADDFTLHWMESNVQDYPRSDAGKILSRLSESGLKQELESALQAKTGSGYLKTSDFIQSAVEALKDSSISKHEIIALSRKYAFGEGDNQVVDVSHLLADI